MKILQLGKFYPIKGGVEKVMMDLTQGLSANGVECDMLCSSFKPVCYSLNPNSKLMAVKAWFKVASTMISPSLVLKLRTIAEDYDIIHVHHPDPMAAVALFLSGYNGKVVLHWHSDILKQRLLLHIYEPLQKWLIKKADLIVGTTPIYVKESKALRDVQFKVNFIPIGIHQICPNEEEVLKMRANFNNKKIIYSLGRLVEYKGYEYLIAAVALLPDDYLLLIGGEGPLRDKLEKQIKKLKIENKVKLLGYIPEDMFANFYGACDLFCLSSIWKTEAFAIVQIEAMSCGKPVVATQIPASGVSWVNKHGCSGVNVPVEDAVSLSKAIREILENGNLYQRYAEGAKKRYFDNFTFQHMVDKCLKLYRQL